MLMPHPSSTIAHRTTTVFEVCPPYVAEIAALQSGRLRGHRIPPPKLDWNTDEALSEMCGMIRESDFIELMYGFMSRRYGDAVGNLATSFIPTRDLLALSISVGYHVNLPLYHGRFSGSVPYHGRFSGSVPHINDKYLWTDCCMYEGKWCHEKAAGKGKFSRPCDTMFEGSFRFGRMKGFGTFTGITGDSYCGAWSADRKHNYRGA